MSALTLINRLTESLLHGEWWIFEDGSIHYCDGDVGDINHEGYAMQHAMGLVRDAMALDDVDDGDSAEELLSAIREAWTEEDASDEERAEDLDDYDIADRMAKKYEVSPGLLAVATGRQASDPRLFAMREWGWHALRDDHAETWELTEKSLQIICRGIDSALDEGGVEADGVDADHEFWINAYQGRRAIKLTYAQIEAQDFSAHFEPPPAAPSAQVRKLDIDGQPGYYGRLGDSVGYSVGYRARAIIEACLAESSDELESDYQRVRDDVEEEWRSHKRHQSWRLVPKAKLVRLYNEYGKYGRINENLLLDVWTILHDTVLKIIVNSETKDNDTWPYNDEPDLTVREASPGEDPNQIDLLLDDPRRPLEPEDMDEPQIEKLKEQEWDRWFLFVSDLSGSTTVRNFGEVKGNARYSDASRQLTQLLQAGYSAETDEARLLAVDRLLNFAHGLGAMAKWLVEGGVATLDQIADYAPAGMTGAGLR